MLARFLGPYLTITSLIAGLRAPDIKALPAEFQVSALWEWVAGGFVLYLSVAGWRPVTRSLLA